MIEHVMPLCLAISWVYSVAMLVQNIVYEKEQRLKEVIIFFSSIIVALISVFDIINVEKHNIFRLIHVSLSINRMGEKNCNTYQ